MDQDRFDERYGKYVEKTEGCWLWTGGRTGDYGRIRWRGQGDYAHRAFWEQHWERRVPEGFQVCHTCDNPLCVNPKHLFRCTQAANNADRDAKGRGYLRRTKVENYDDFIADVLNRAGSDQEIADRHGVSRVYVRVIRKKYRDGQIPVRRFRKAAL